jgi:hypothetical protein
LIVSREASTRSSRKELTAVRWASEPEAEVAPVTSANGTAKWRMTVGTY